MSISKFINIPLFIVSFTIGIFGVYVLSNQDKRKIIVNPTPDNINKIQYKDDSGSCFQFKQYQVKCPKDQSKIIKVAAQ